MFYVYIIIAYLLGSISTSTLLAKTAGVDIKKEGSGNAGTTNALRVLGKKAAIITLVCDILKGVLAVGFGRIDSTKCAYFCALAVVIGHIFPVFFKFKGGKGVATTFGAVLMVNWKVGIIALAVVIIITIISKRMSAGSICGAIALVAASLFLERPFWTYATIIALIIIIKHKDNIKRLLKGKEPPLGLLARKKDEN